MGGGELYEFGPFSLEPAERRLSRSGDPVAITPKCFDLLVVLVENSGHLLSKGELLERVWPGQFVEESNLSFNISELRRLLGDGRNDVRYIETVRKNGFRFVARVHNHRELEADPAAADAAMPALPDQKDEIAKSLVSGGDVERTTPELAVVVGRRRFATWKFVASFVAAGALALSAYFLWVKRTATSTATPFKTIAVLPFKPLLSSARDESLELGMAETLIGRIGAADAVSVRPISAVRRYMDLEQDAVAAGRELGVEAVLDGYIQRAGGRLRVTARLVQVADGRQLWAGRFDEQFTDIFAVQDTISEQVARSLALRLSGDAERRLVHSGTRSPQAYELYLKGRFFLNKRTGVEVEKAIDHFRQALALDSHYALAYSGLADAYPLLSAPGDVPPRESFPMAKDAAEHALSLDDTLAEAHSSLAFVKEAFDWDFARAEAEYRRAITLDPDYATARHRYGMFLMMMSRSEEGLAELERARQLDPTSLIINADVGLANYFARRYDQCIKHLRNTVEMHPTSFRPHINLVGCYVQSGLIDDGIAEAQKALALMIRGGPGASAVLSYSYAAAGRHRDARAILNQWAAQPRRFAQPFSAAAAYAALGERDKAMELLEAGYEQRAYMLRIGVDPALDSLRSDPRFQDLVRRVRPRQ